MPRHLRTLFALLMLMTTGCVSSRIVDQTTLPRADRPVAEQLVVARLARNPDIITEDYEPFFAAIERGVHRELPQTGLFERTINEREIGVTPPSGRVFLVRYRATDFADVTSVRGAYVAMYAVSYLVVPVVFLGLVHPRKETIRTTWEMQVFDVTNVPLREVHEREADEVVRVYDTSELTPLVRREYEIRTEAKLGYEGQEARLEFSRELAAEIGRQLMAASRDDLASAVRHEQSDSSALAMAH